jgi:tetratricopeptide (TPR) repeat protein
VKTAPKPGPQVTDEQWEAGKKDYTGQAHEALGMAALARKNYAGCSQNLGLAVSNSMQPDPATMVRLGNCLRMEKKYDEAIAMLDKAIADPSSAAIVKQAATQEKMEANKAKAAPAPKQ